jgi:quinol monooxygenase YgiN
MLIVHVEFETAPETRETALKALRAEAPRATAMRGNLGYAVRVDPDHAGQVTLLHQWERPVDFLAYKASPLFRRIGGALFPLMVGTPSTRYYSEIEAPT